MRSLLLVPCLLFSIFSLSACGPAVGGGSGELIVAGTVEREIQDHAWNDAFDPSGDAHAVFEVRRYQGEDASAPLVTSTDVPFSETLPFPFEVRGDVDVASLDGQKLLVSVSIFNHPGTTIAVGDLASEYSNEAAVGDGDMKVLVTGVESCSAPNAGGFCTSAE